MSDKVMTPEEVFGKIILDRDNGVQTVRDNNLAVARQAYEACAKVMCPDCAADMDKKFTRKKGQGDIYLPHWWHISNNMLVVRCRAEAIHALSDAELMGGAK